MEKNWYAALTISEQNYLLQSGVCRKHVNCKQDLWLVASLFAAVYARFSPEWYDLIRRLSEVK